MIGRTDIVEHQINTEECPPIRSNPYHAPQQTREKIDQFVEEMLENDIEESRSPWSSPIALFKKKDANFRFCSSGRKIL
jgi:hypothetical protein